MSATVQNNMIWIYRENRLCEIPSLADALGILGAQKGRPAASAAGASGSPGCRCPARCPVVSAVGAGGKTTTLHRLAEDFVRQGQQAVVTTSTHILEEDEPYFLRAAAGESLTEQQLREAAKAFADQVREKLDRFGQVWTGSPAPGGKLCGLPGSFLEQIRELGVPVLIEADGARKMPLKVPAGHEPVIDPRTTHVLSVYGLDAVGQKLETVCFRKEQAEKILKKNGTEPVTAEDIALLASSPEAGRKGCPEQAGYTVVLNKADNAKRRETALHICRLLNDRGIGRVVVTSHIDVRKQ